MIKIHLDTDEFEYDVRSMVKAFYPEEFLFVYCDISKVQQQNHPKEDTFLMELHLFEKEKQIVIEIKKEQEVFTESQESVGERKERKNVIKQLLYKSLSRITGKTLPWGTLTGIRPTKLIVKELEAGVSEQQIVRDMCQMYLVSEDKLNTGIHISQKERRILGNLSEEEGYSLYVHIPFCPTTCLYCSFTSFPAKKFEAQMDGYVDAVIKELAFVAEHFKKKSLNTIYFGGGTPTTLSDKQLERLICFIKNHFPTEQLQEFTVEAGRPDSITIEKLRVLKEQGVTRISINPQTMHQKTLDLLGRHHTVEEIRSAFEMARACGHDNINMDIILGLPEEGTMEVEETLQQIALMKPDNLTVHCLARKHNARLNLEKDKYQNLRFLDVTEAMEISEEYAKQMGMEPYYMYRQKNIAGNQENVGYALPGKEGIYNILIMEERQSIIAVGAGAITKIVGKPGELLERVENVKDISTYLDRVDDMIERKNKAFHQYGLWK